MQGAGVSDALDKHSHDQGLEDLLLWLSCWGEWPPVVRGLYFLIVYNLRGHGGPVSLFRSLTILRTNPHQPS